jgi:hypothetical protein
MSSIIDTLEVRLKLQGLTEVEQGMAQFEEAIKNSTRKVREHAKEEVATFKAYGKEVKLALDQYYKDINAMLDAHYQAEGFKKVKNDWKKLNEQNKWVRSSASEHSAAVIRDIKEYNRKFKEIADKELFPAFFDAGKKMMDKLHEGAEKAATQNAQKTQGVISKLFFGTSKGGVTEKLLTGAGFGSMFMRWAVMQQALDTLNEVKNLALGRPLKEIGKNEFGLASVGIVTPLQLQAAQYHARNISNASGGMVSTAEVLDAMAEMGSAMDIKEVGMEGLAAATQQALNFSLMTRMPFTRGAKTLAMTQKAFENQPEMKGLTVPEQLKRISNILGMTSAELSMAFGEDELKFMRHAMGIGLFRGMSLPQMMGYLGAFRNVGYESGQTGRSYSHIFGPKGEEDFARIMLAGGFEKDYLPELNRRKGQVSAKELIKQFINSVDYAEIMKDPETAQQFVGPALVRGLERGHTLKELAPSQQWASKEYHYWTELAKKSAELTKKLEGLSNAVDVAAERLKAAKESEANTANRWSRAWDNLSEAMSKATLNEVGGLVDATSNWAKRYTTEMDMRESFKKVNSWKDIEDLYGGPSQEAGIKLFGKEAYVALLGGIISSRPDLIFKRFGNEHGLQMMAAYALKDTEGHSLTDLYGEYMKSKERGETGYASFVENYMQGMYFPGMQGMAKKILGNANPATYEAMRASELLGMPLPPAVVNDIKAWMPPEMTAQQYFSWTPAPPYEGYGGPDTTTTVTATFTKAVETVSEGILKDGKGVASALGTVKSWILSAIGGGNEKRKETTFAPF